MQFTSCSEPINEGDASMNQQKPVQTEAATIQPPAAGVPEQAAAMQRKPLVTDIYTADPSAHVFDGRIYIYPSHDLDYQDPVPTDEDGNHYMMEDYHVLSMDGPDSPCVDHGQVLHLSDIPWARQQLWAPDAAGKNGKYYLYFPAKDNDLIFRMGVAVSDSPAGPFTAEPDYIQGSFSIDPAVFVDDDGRAYMVFGGIWGGQLERWQTGEYDPAGSCPVGTEPALGPQMAEMTDDMLSFKEPAREISIVDQNGSPIPAADETRRFFEGSWIHKYNGKYYLSYSTGTTHFLVYATSDNIWGPYVYQGRILNPVAGWTTHHSIVEFEGKWYLFYHDAKLSGVDYKRNAMFTELTYNEDGTIQTMNPYQN